ncbi:SAM-dependent chlorinase/fluorinase [Candidatus Poribacteria bacterium]|nr:SAM-dependent chlorinase/fluorinase [Candidatus Poribacteria bacterium]
MKNNNNFLSISFSLIACILMTIPLMIGCSGKTIETESSEMPTLSGTITEIDDHGNAVTDISVEAFTKNGWKLGDSLEVDFSTGQKITIKYVENYSDVSDGGYLGRFSTTTGKFKIAINNGYLADALKLKIKTTIGLRKEWGRLVK